MLITKSKTIPIGLDISDLSLKLAQLKRFGDKVKLQSLNKIGLPLGLINKGEIKDEEALLKLLITLLNKPKYGSVTSSDVAVCLPDSKTFIKLIKVDKNPNNLSDIISAEIEKNIPLAIKDIYYDWQIISENNYQYYVLIGACTKNVVDQYISLLHKAGLTVVALEIESAAICRCLLKQESPKYKGPYDKNYAIIDIGAKRSNLTIYAKNTIVLSISMPIAGNEITDRIADSLEIKKDQAEKAKIICGMDNGMAQGIICDLLSDMIEELVNKINEALYFYQTHYSELGPIQEILLCGGGANIKNINKIMSERVKIPTTIGNVFNNIWVEPDLVKVFMETHSVNLSKNKTEDKISIEQNSATSFATAFGLALRNTSTSKI